MKQSVRERITNILSRCRDMTIATLGTDGAPHATVVSYVHDGLLIYFGCGRDTQKSRNLSNDRRVSITVTAPYRDWMHIEGLSLAGAAGEVTTSVEKSKVAALMVARFPKVAGMAKGDREDLSLFRVRPSLVSVLDYKQGFGHTDIVAISADDITESRGQMRHRWISTEWV